MSKQSGPRLLVREGARDEDVVAHGVGVQVEAAQVEFEGKF